MSLGQVAVEPRVDSPDGEGMGCMIKKTGLHIILLLACLAVIPDRQAVLARSPANLAGPSTAEGAPPTPAETARFVRISTADGLSNDVVYAILQDRRGFMWFGTDNGLTRYNGYRFTVYQSDPSDPTSLTHATVYALYETRDGGLWIGTRGGLDRFDPATGTFSHYIQGRTVAALYEDETGVLWVGTPQGLTFLDPANPEPAAFIYGTSSDAPDRLSGSLVYEIVGTQAGEVWLATGLGEFATGTGLDRFDGSTGTFVHYRHDLGDPASLGSGDVRAIVEDGQGGLWIGTDGGLNHLDRSSETFIRYQHDPGDPFSLANDQVLAVLEDSAGRLWIGTADGLDQFDRIQNRFVHYRHERSDLHSLSDNIIAALYEDRSGVVWIGTTAGISRFDEVASQFVVYQNRPDSPYPLSDDFVLAVCEDRNGDVWVGTEKGGLNRLDLASGTTTVYRHDPADPASLSSDGVTALHEDRAGDVWVGMDSRWLERFDPQTETFVHAWYLSAGEPGIIAEDGEGDLWVGTPNGLYRLDRATDTAIHYRTTTEPALSSNYVTTIYELQDGRLLVGTDGGGVNIWDPATEQFETYRRDPANPDTLAHDSVYAFYEDPNEGVVWIGTWQGLDRVERATQRVSHYTEDDGLPGNAVLGIVADSAGMLWLTTNRGLSRFDPHADTFHNYDARDGLPAWLVWTAFSRRKDGEILIGSRDGLVAFYPERIADNPYPPPVVITTLSLFNEVIRRDLVPDERVELTYKENFLSFQFAALDYTAPERNQYAYKLEGLDPDWVQAGTRRRADYPNLRPGNYVLRVKGSNNAGVWNEEGTSVRISITPPPWGTWWFRTIVALALGGAVAVAYRWRVRSIEARSRELEQQVADRTAELSQANVLLEQEIAERVQVEQALRQSEREKAVVDERNRLARELHDSVAQSMYGVTLLAEVASQLLSSGQADQVAGYLGELKETAKESLAEMRLLIYELRPPVLEEEGLVSALQARLEAVESRAGLETEFHLVGEPTLGAQVEEALFRIAREALNNLLKHAQARRVVVSLRQDGRSVTLEIADDGTGFDPSSVRRSGGLGLRGMEERATEIGARLEIDSAAGNGTTVRVIWEGVP